MNIDRVQKLGSRDFVRGYVQRNHPVLVEDAMATWPASSRWTPAYFRQRFGDLPTQLYDDLFFLVRIRPLKDYIDRYMEAPAPSASQRSAVRVPYVRWYSRQNPRRDMPWSDQVFRSLARDWSCPGFFPQDDLLLPFAGEGVGQNPVHDSFPARAIFLSARGARTRLHVDPWSSDAILCQLSGRKRFVLYPPRALDALSEGGKLIDVRYDVDLDRWDTPVEPWYDGKLEPGEALLIPGGWPHAFHTVAPSISLTWNYLHSVSRARLKGYLRSGVPAHEAAALRYFMEPGRQDEGAAAETAA
ncbi:MAG: cupin-like domain-containing protein [Burkholderiales bacterium]|nr:cupin-like domain-containing protein [Burkholderiales bacterium]